MTIGWELELGNFIDTRETRTVIFLDNNSDLNVFLYVPNFQTWKNTQTCKLCLCTFFSNRVNFFILPAICFVKARKGLCKKNISNLDCVNFSCFCGTEYWSLIPAFSSLFHLSLRCFWSTHFPPLCAIKEKLTLPFNGHITTSRNQRACKEIICKEWTVLKNMHRN